MLAVIFDSGHHISWKVGDPIDHSVIPQISHIYAEGKEAEYIIELYWYTNKPTIPIPDVENSGIRTRPIYWYGDIAKTIVANL